MKRVMVMGATGGGMARFRKQLLADLAQAGTQVFAVADYDHEQDRDTVARRNVIPVHLPQQRAGINPFSELFCLWRVVRLMLRVRPDMVLLYTIKPVIYGGLVSRALRVPERYALITGTGAAFESSQPGRKPPLRRLVEVLYRHAMKGMKRVFFQNEDNRRLFVDNRLVEEATSVVVPGSGVDLDEFAFRELSGADKRVRFLYLGRYLDDKGFLDYLDAARAVQRISSDALFLTAGKFDSRSGRRERDALRQAVDDDIVRDLGFVEDVAQCLAGIDVLVLPSYGEGVPHSVLEAMAIGRPIVTTDAPGCRDTVRDGCNGLLVPPGDRRALAAAMRELAADPGRLPAMGRASRAMAEQQFSVGRVNHMMLDAMGLARDAAHPPLPNGERDASPSAESGPAPRPRSTRW